MMDQRIGTNRDTGGNVETARRVLEALRDRDGGSALVFGVRVSYGITGAADMGPGGVGWKVGELVTQDLDAAVSEVVRVARHRSVAEAYDAHPTHATRVPADEARRLLGGSDAPAHLGAMLGAEGQRGLLEALTDLARRCGVDELRALPFALEAVRLVNVAVDKIQGATSTRGERSANRPPIAPARETRSDLIGAARSWVNFLRNCSPRQTIGVAVYLATDTGIRDGLGGKWGIEQVGGELSIELGRLCVSVTAA